MTDWSPAHSTAAREYFTTPPPIMPVAPANKVSASAPNTKFVDLAPLKIRASGHRRVFALLIDGTIGSLLIWFVSLFVAFRSDLAVIGMGCAFLCYLVLRDSVLLGGGLGKHACGVILLNTATGQPLGRLGSVTRQVGLYLPLALFGAIGYKTLACSKMVPDG